LETLNHRLRRYLCIALAAITVFMMGFIIYKTTVVYVPSNHLGEKSFTPSTVKEIERLSEKLLKEKEEQQ